jgi:hypothetical protein
MTDHTIARAELFGADFHRSTLSRMLHNWWVRRQLVRLADADALLLDDVGVERSEIEWAIHLPLSINPALALRERSQRRRRRQSAGWER